MFKLVSPFRITPAQKQAVDKLAAGLDKGDRHQTLLGITGSGKTFVMANVIKKVKKPTLILSPNKVLAAQLYEEFRAFFPDNAVHYFVSYYDYYQPEAYIPQTDTYIKKDAKINKEIDRLRHQAVQALLQRDDVIIVASVSAIYNLGSPQAFEKLKLMLKAGQEISKKEIMARLVDLQYERNDYEFEPGIFRTRAEFIDVWEPGGKYIWRIKNAGGKIKELRQIRAPFGKQNKVDLVHFWPAKFWLQESSKINIALSNIRLELQAQITQLKKQNKVLEAERLRRRTLYDLSLIEETGWCHGIENYSRHLDFRQKGEPPFTLLDYYLYAPKLRPASGGAGRAKDFLLFLDESHISVPQVRGMYEGDKARKQVLVEHGFRLPSCLDNRPLKFAEFLQKINQVVYVSATPAQFEKNKSSQVVEQLIRPTGLLDPDIEVKPSEGQMKDVITQIAERVSKGQRVLVTTLTKRLAEAVAKHLTEQGIKATFLHSEIRTLERPGILADLRQGRYDVLVGINLLREGLDLPEVSLILILDADKEGFLRNRTSLIQVMGRAARHVGGHIVMYADRTTGSMQQAIKEVERRRKIQENYNKAHHITPSPITKEVRTSLPSPPRQRGRAGLGKEEFAQEYLEELQEQLDLAQRNLQFEKAAQLTKQIKQFSKGGKDMLR